MVKAECECASVGLWSICGKEGGDERHGRAVLRACVICCRFPPGRTLTMDRESTGLPWDGALSTKSGGMSYQMLESADPEHELDVIKAILLREVRVHKSTLSFSFCTRV